jgi:hypothetical protein
MEQQKKKFKEVLQKTEDIKNFYEENVKELQYILDYMGKDISIKESDNIETMILKKYIEYGAIKRVCDFLNDKGYRLITKDYNRKYTADDVSQIIYPYKRHEDDEEKFINADEELKEVVKKMHLYIFDSSYGRLKVKELNK